MRSIVTRDGTEHSDVSEGMTSVQGNEHERLVMKTGCKVET